MIPFDYWIGCELGQRHDYTTLAILEEPVWIPSALSDTDRLLAPTGAAGWVSLDARRPVEREHWRVYAERHGRPSAPPRHLRHLARWRDVSYPATVSRIATLLGTAPLRKIAGEVGCTPAQLAIAWVLAQPGVVTIPKSSTRERVKENFEALAVTLSSEVLAELDRAFPPPKGKQSLEML